MEIKTKQNKEINFRMFSSNTMREKYVDLLRWERLPETQKRIELNDDGNHFSLKEAIYGENQNFNAIIQIKDNNIRTEITFYSYSKNFIYEKTSLKHNVHCKIFHNKITNETEISNINYLRDIFSYDFNHDGTTKLYSETPFSVGSNDRSSQTKLLEILKLEGLTENGKYPIGPFLNEITINSIFKGTSSNLSNLVKFYYKTLGFKVTKKQGLAFKSNLFIISFGHHNGIIFDNLLKSTKVIKHLYDFILKDFNLAIKISDELRKCGYNDYDNRYGLEDIDSLIQNIVNMQQKESELVVRNGAINLVAHQSSRILAVELIEKLTDWKDGRVSKSLLNDTINMAITLKKKVNYNWSKIRFTEEHDKMVKEIIPYKILNYELVKVDYKDVKFPNIEGLSLFTNSHELVEESMVMNHCIGTSSNYINQAQRFNSILLKYDIGCRGTIELRKTRDYDNETNETGEIGIYEINQFKLKNNNTPSDRYLDEFKVILNSPAMKEFLDEVILLREQYIIDNPESTYVYEACESDGQMNMG